MWLRNCTDDACQDTVFQEHFRSLVSGRASFSAGIQNFFRCLQPGLPKSSCATRCGRLVLFSGVDLMLGETRHAGRSLRRWRLGAAMAVATLTIAIGTANRSLRISSRRARSARRSRAGASVSGMSRRRLVQRQAPRLLTPREGAEDCVPTDEAASPLHGRARPGREVPAGFRCSENGGPYGVAG